MLTEMHLFKYKPSYKLIMRMHRFSQRKSSSHASLVASIKKGLRTD